MTTLSSVSDTSKTNLERFHFLPNADNDKLSPVRNRRETTNPNLNSHILKNQGNRVRRMIEYSEALVNQLNSMLDEDVRNWSPNFVEALSERIFSGLSSRVLNSLQFSHWSVLPINYTQGLSRRIPELTGSTFNNWTFSQLSGMSRDDRRNISTSAIADFDYYTITAFSSEDFHDFSQSQISAFLARVIQLNEPRLLKWFLATISDAQFHNIASSELDRVPPEILFEFRQRMTPLQRVDHEILLSGTPLMDAKEKPTVTGLTLQEIRNQGLNHPLLNDAQSILLMNARQIRELPAEDVNRLGADILNSLPDELLNALDRAQIGAIERQEVIENLSFSFYRRLLPEQGGYLSEIHRRIMSRKNIVGELYLVTSVDPLLNRGRQVLSVDEIRRGIQGIIPHFSIQDWRNMDRDALHSLTEWTRGNAPVSQPTPASQHNNNRLNLQFRYLSASAMVAIAWERQILEQLSTENLQAIPIERMAEGQFQVFFRNLPIDRWSDLTLSQQTEILRRLGWQRFPVVPGYTGVRSSSPTPPPPGAGGVGGSSSGSAAAFPTLTRAQVAALGDRFGMTYSAQNTRQNRMLSFPSSLMTLPATFWNDVAGPKKESKVVGSTSQGLPIVQEWETDWEEYHRFIQKMPRSLALQIPATTLKDLELKVYRAFSAKQLMWMWQNPQQNSAITREFIRLKVEKPSAIYETVDQSLAREGIKRLLNITKDRWISLAELEARIRGLDPQAVKTILTPQLIQTLGKDQQQSLILFLLQPKHFQVWDAERIQALPDDVMETWPAEYHNSLPPELSIAMGEKFKAIPLPVFRELEKGFFEYQGTDPKLHQQFRNRFQQLTPMRKQFIRRQVIEQFGPKFLENYLKKPDDILDFSVIQRQAFSFKDLPTSWYYRLITDNNGDVTKARQVLKDLTPKQTVDFWKSILRNFGRDGYLREALLLVHNLDTWQIHLIPDNEIVAIPTINFSAFKQDFLNRLKLQHRQSLPGALIAGIGTGVIPRLSNAFIGDLSIAQVSYLTPEQVSVMSEKQIQAFGDKVSHLNPNVFLNAKALKNLLAHATPTQLSKFRQEQIQRMDLKKIPVVEFGRLCDQKGMPFVKMFSEQLKIEDHSAYRRIIANKYYAQLIQDIHQKLTEEERRSLAVNMSLTEYQVGFAALIEALGKKEITLTDVERKAIFLGTYRVKMEKDLTTQNIMFAAGQVGGPYNFNRTQISPLLTHSGQGTSFSSDLQLQIPPPSTGRQLSAAMAA